MRSVLGNIPNANAANCPKKILHFNDFSNVTLGTPAFVTTKQYTQTITSASIVSSIMNGFFDTSYVLQLQLTTDRDVVGADNAAKLVDLATLIENSIVTVPGPFGSNVSALYQNTKVRTTTIGAANSAPQNWLRILRNAPGAGGSGVPGSDMKKFYCSYWLQMQVDGADPLATNLDYLHVSGNAFWRVFFDVKTGGYLGYEGGGDLRWTVRIQEDATGLYWRVQVDNSADNVTVPGVTGAHATFWQVDSRESIPSDGEWFKFEIEITMPDPTQRSKPSAHPDLTTGRTKVSITRASTLKSVVICDKRGDVHMGVHDLPPTQMFFNGVYSLAGGKINQYIYDLQIWDKTKREMGYIDARNHGPLPWVPTPLARATHYASYGGIGSSPGTYSNPMSLDTIIGSAVAGNVVFIRGGTINATAKYRFNGNNGTAGNPIIFEVYPGETLTIDGSTGVPGVDDWCGRLQSSFTYLRGDMRFINMPAQGLLIDGSDNILDGVSATGNHLSGAEVYEASGLACRNTFINGIYTDNSDVGYSLGGLADGNNADGITISNGTGNKVQHCTLLRNSDDGVDTARSINSVVEYCISGLNGLGAGDGNGIKAGLASTGSGTIVRYNLAYSNRAAGIDSNTVIAGVFSSNTTYGNGTYGYIFESDTVATRNVSSGDAAVHGATTGTMTRNSWDISGTLTLVSTNPASSDFLKVTQDGTFNGIGAHYL